MKQKKTALRAGLFALTALLAAGMASSSAWADGDKGKGKKPTPIIIGPITKTVDKPTKK